MLISTLSHALGATIEVMQCLFFVSQLLRSHFGTARKGESQKFVAVHSKELKRATLDSNTASTFQQRSCTAQSISHFLGTGHNQVRPGMK